MAVVFVPHHEPWIVSRSSFRLLMKEAEADLEDLADVEVLRQAVALDGLHFDHLERDQAVRVARSLAKTADSLRMRLRSQWKEERELEFAEYLARLEALLHDIFE